MDLRQIPIFGAITRRMHWLNQRQEVLAQNIANSDTPGYRARDLKPTDFAEQASPFRQLRLAGTAPGHMQPRKDQGDFRADKQKDVYEVAPTDNSVVIEEQMLKVAKTRIDYETMTTLYKRHVSMIRTALGTK